VSGEQLVREAARTTYCGKVPARKGASHLLVRRGATKRLKAVAYLIRYALAIDRGLLLASGPVSGSLCGLPASGVDGAARGNTGCILSYAAGVRLHWRGGHSREDSQTAAFMLIDGRRRCRSGVLATC